MNKISIYKTFIVLAVCAVLIVPVTAVAGTDVKTLQGTIQGALCVLEGKTCPPDDLDAHLIIENNFVLLAADGKYFYLPNLNRNVLARYVGKDVQITGKVKDESIIVKKLEVKDGGKYKLVWTIEKQKRDIINYFENVPMG
jgi:hypothetical protein